MFPDHMTISMAREPGANQLEVKFASGGMGAILSSFVPVQMRGRILPDYATIDRDECIPFWRELGKTRSRIRLQFILQLSHGGRERDLPGFEFPVGLSSTDRADPLHGFPAVRMTKDDITETINGSPRVLIFFEKRDWMA